MYDVKVNKAELLGILRTNKEKHIAEFKEAVEDFKKAVTKIAEDNLKLVQTGDLTEIAKVRSNPPKPTSYEDSYTRAIRMLELSVDEVIELDASTFSQLVLDEWQWKQAFSTSNSTYKALT